MVEAIGTIPIGVFAIVLLFVPGLLGLDLYFRYSESRRSLSRTQILVYSAFVSLTSLALMYLSSPVYLDLLNHIAVSIADTVGLATSEDVSDMRMATYLSLYAIHIGLSVAVGTGTGMLVEQRSEEERDRREPWHYAFSVVPSDGEEIEVVMEDGTIISGEFNEEAWDEGRRELYLDNPWEIEYDVTGDTVQNRIDLGRSVLLQEGAISRVVFTESDPQSSLRDEIEEYVEELPDEITIKGDLEDLSDQQSLEEYEESTEGQGSDDPQS